MEEYTLCMAAFFSSNPNPQDGNGALHSINRYIKLGRGSCSAESGHGLFASGIFGDDRSSLQNSLMLSFKVRYNAGWMRLDGKSD